MNHLRKLLVATVLFSAGSLAVSHAETKLSPYEQAVSDYIKAAESELKVLDTEVATELKANPDKKRKFENFFQKMDAAEDRLDALKKSTANNFDSLKMSYEKSREDMVKALQKARNIYT